ncbi:hypothetical protein BDW74DRAFT_159966 [Aspergillus multicolor]|uniref:uncharacterized protein n=1 Tax=Aspergillus multicolor TaxID=41759 RepID=UPI003CCC9087
MASDWATITTTSPGVPTETTVVDLIPPNTSTASSTWFIHSGTTTQVYTTWTPGATTGTPVTQELPVKGAAEGDSTTSTSTSGTSGLTSSATSTSNQNEPVGSSSATSPSSSPTPSSNNSSSTQTPKVESSRSSGGFSSGTLAGAIVGSIIGTALLTLLLAFLFCRRRRPQASSPTKTAFASGIQYDKAGIAVSESGTGVGAATGAALSLASITPQPADDETVRRRILTLIDQANLHIDNYYVLSSSSSPPYLAQDDAVKLAKYDSDVLPDSIVNLLRERAMQKQVVTHVLVYTLLKGISPGGALLPPVFSAQPQVETRSSSTNTPSYLFAWRMLTAHLYTKSNTRSNLSDTTQATQNLATEFTSAFAPYASDFSESDRLSHLQNLAKATAELGSWLFAQPCTFKFVWSKSSHGFAVTPGVLKIFDERGRTLVSPQVLVEEEAAGF